MTGLAERELASAICGCATGIQRRRDIKLIRAYGDQREREALERALSLIEAVDWKYPQNIISVCCAIRALIPKGPTND